MRFDWKTAACLLLAASVSFYAGAARTSTALQTRIETDQKTGAIRFIVNGTEQARIDAAGIRVRRNVEYGGSLTDTGSVNDYPLPAKR